MVAPGVWPAGECREIDLQRQVESCPQLAAGWSAWAQLEVMRAWSVKDCALPAGTVWLWSVVEAAFTCQAQCP